MKLVTEAEAEVELEDAALWYEEQSEGLGERFLAAVAATVQGIREFPRLGAQVPYVSEDLGIRRMPVRRFPYQVVYLVSANAIHVLAIAHDRRKPGYWARRAGRK